MHVPLAANFLDITPNQIILIASGILLVFVIKRWRAVTIKRKRATENPTAPGSPQSALSAREIRAELAALLADLEETARRVSAQIENRRTGLDLLLKEADEKIKRLEELTKTAKAADPRPAAPIAVSTTAAQLINRLRQERGAAAATPPATAAPVEDSVNRPIYALADAGKSAREIAQILNRQPGEVELILALRPKQRA